MLAIIAGMRLPPIISKHLLANAGIDLYTNSEKDKCYIFLVLNYYEEGLEVWNAFIRKVQVGEKTWTLP